MDAIQESDIDQLLTLILDELSQRKDEEILTVEDVQDVVEMMILREGYRTLGKKYMLYREKRSLMRGDKQTRVNVIETMEEYLEQSDRRVNENANQ